MTGPDSLIADALRELAEQAAPPRLPAAAAWRSGRRRRRTAAALVPLATANGPARPRHEAVVPITLASPIQFRQVARIGSAPCPANSGGLPAEIPPRCIYLTGAVVTIRKVESLHLASRSLGGCMHTGGYMVYFVLVRANWAAVAALTGKLADLRGPGASPRNQMAIIVAGRLVSHGPVQGQFSSSAQISCIPSRTQAEQLFQALRTG